MPAELNPDVDRFDRWAPKYDQSWMQRWYFGPVHAAMLDELAAHGSSEAPRCVLDIGCGTGRLLRAAALRWPQAKLTGVDPAEHMVTEARRLTPSADIRVAPAESIPFSDSSMDLVLTSLSFHHWADQRRGLQEIVRVLRPGGRLCFADHTAPGWLVLHERSRSWAELRSMMSEAGLKVCERHQLWSRFVRVVVACRNPVTGGQDGQPVSKEA